MVIDMISVIMLTCNREDFVGACIESIINQTYTDFEYIIIDNGSSDKSGEIAERYAQKDSRIKVVHTGPNSIGGGRNLGLDLASGEFITFVDDDDIANLEMLEFLYVLTVKNKADISICGTNLKSYNESFVMNPENALIELFERKYYNVGFPGKLIKRKLFEKNRFFEVGKFDDIYLMPRIFASANKVAYHGLNYYHVNRHNNNNSAWTTNYQLLTLEILNEYLEVYRNRTIWLEKQFPHNVYTWRYFEWSFMISMIDKIEINNIVSCRGLLYYLKKELRSNYDRFLSSPHIKEFEKDILKKYII